MTSGQPLPRKKKIVFGLVAAGILIIILELVSYLLLSFSEAWYGQPIVRVKTLEQAQAKAIRDMFNPRPDSLAIFDGTLGWTARKNLRSPDVNTNAIGSRGVREYPPQPEANVLRVGVFGDSFTFGTGVRDAESWPAQLERLSPDIEAMNFAVPGYGVDQVLMRYREEKGGPSPRITLLALAPVTVLRTISVVTGFRVSQPFSFTKPRFTLDERGALVLHANPVKTEAEAKPYLDDPSRIVELKEHDYWYEPLMFENPLFDYSATMRVGVSLWSRMYTRFFDDNRPLRGPPKSQVFNDQSEMFRVLMALLETFVAESKAQGAIPVILVLPDTPAIFGKNSNISAVYQPIIAQCQVKGLPCLDAIEAFRAPDAPPPEKCILPDSHYTPPANEAVAKWVGPQLKRLAGASADLQPQ